METKYLETVLRVAENMSFSRAAEEVPCAQSVVSRHVRLVEEELGVKIFERSQKSNQVKLTPDGAKILPLIRRVTEEISALTKTTSTMAAARKTEYSIGILLGVVGYYVQNRFLQELYLQFPNVVVRFVPLTLAEIPEFIRDRKVDAMLIYEPYWAEEPGIPSFAEEPDVFWEKLRRQDPLIAMPPSHMMAQEKYVKLEQLAKETFIVNFDITQRAILPAYKMHEGFLRSCLAAGFTPQIATMDDAACANLRNIAVMQYGQLYPTFLCPCLEDNSGVAFVPLQNPIYYSNYYFLWFGKGKKEISREILAFFKRKFQEQA